MTEPLFAGLPLTPIVLTDLRVPLLPMHRPYGAMVADGVKTIETRGRPWIFNGPRWIALYNAEKVAKLQREVAILPGARPYLPPGRYRSTGPEWEAYEQKIGPAGVVLGLAFITGSVPLRPADIGASFFYEPDRHAWIVQASLRFKTPIPLETFGVSPPQSFVYIDRAPLVAAIVESTPGAEPPTMETR